MERTETSKTSAGSQMNNSSTLFSQESVQELSQSMNDMTERVKKAADTAVTESINFAKKYPLHTALGAIAIGFIAGFLVRSSGKTTTK